MHLVVFRRAADDDRLLGARMAGKHAAECLESRGAAREIAGGYGAREGCLDLLVVLDDLVEPVARVLAWRASWRAFARSSSDSVGVTARGWRADRMASGGELIDVRASGRSSRDRASWA